MPSRPSLDQVVLRYLGFVLKNVVGWIAIIASPILGILLPGPGGLPLFIIGFALVTLPGKRRLTTHVFRGRRLPIDSPLFTGLITFFSVVVTAGLMWAAWHYYERIVERLPLQEWGVGTVAQLVGIAALAAPVTMGVTWVSLWVINLVLVRFVPPVRRFLRRTLRRWGVRLLPARRRRIGGATQFVGDEIIGIDDSLRQRLARWVRDLSPWARQVVVVTIVLGVLYFVVAPVVREWPEIEARLGRLQLLPLFGGTLLFAVGLLAFRAGTWTLVLRGLGRRLPPRAAARAWATGHLARFVPGRTFAVLRMELVRPYGVPASQAHAAGRTENVLATVAAFAVASAASLVVAWEALPQLRPLWVALAAVVPLLYVVASPRVLYRLVPGIGRGTRTRIAGRRLVPLAAWQTLGVAWQGVAVWLLVGGPLAPGTAVDVLPAVMAAWALAFAAGHVASFVPAGLGVRELVFAASLAGLLPADVRLAAIDAFRQTAALAIHEAILSDPFGEGLTAMVRLFTPAEWQDAWWAFLFFLSLLLRIATTLAELGLTLLTNALDFRGVIGTLRSYAYAPATR